MSPEQRVSGVYDTESEVYALRLIAYEVFNRATIVQMGKLAGYNSSTKLVGAFRLGWRPEFLETCPRAMQVLIRQCTHPDPNQRPPLSQVIAAIERFSNNTDIENSVNGSSTKKGLVRRRSSQVRLLSSRVAAWAQNSNSFFSSGSSTDGKA
jgi:hypothetical protein